MKHEMSVQEIDTRIGELTQELNQVHGRKTEVYSRIVGYYRAVSNWNRGKREEYRHRKTYAYPENLPEPEARIRTVAAKNGRPTLDRIASYHYFYRTSCPNCPAVKSYLDELAYPGHPINVDQDDGFSLAGNLAVAATPTVIFRDNEGNEVVRVSGIEELVRLFEAEAAVS